MRLDATACEGGRSRAYLDRGEDSRRQFRGILAGVLCLRVRLLNQALDLVVQMGCRHVRERFRAMDCSCLVKSRICKLSLNTEIRSCCSCERCPRASGLQFGDGMKVG